MVLMKWRVYILKSARGYFYVGVTTDVKRRLLEHNGEKKGGAKYTKANRPYVLVWSRACVSRSDAQAREYALKQLSHEEKEALVRKSVAKREGRSTITGV